MSPSRATSALATALSVALLTGVAACGGEPASEPGDKTVVLYSGRSETLIKPLLDKFTQETGIVIKARYGTTAQMAAQLVEEGERSPAEAFLSQDAGALGAVNKKGLLATLPAEVTAKVPAAYRADDGNWIGVTARSRVLVYNPSLVKKEDLPASVFDLADPRWNGKVAIAPTNASFQTFVTAVRLQHGEEKAKAFFTALKANGVQIRNNNVEIVADVDAGKMPMGLVNHYYLGEIAKERGTTPEKLTAKLHFFAAGDSGAMVNVSGIGVLRRSATDADVRTLVDYLLGAKAQTYFAEQIYEYPVVEGAAGPAYVPPLAELKAPAIDLNDLETLDESIALIKATGLTPLIASTVPAGRPRTAVLPAVRRWVPRPLLLAATGLALLVALLPLGYLLIRAGEAGAGRITEELLTARVGWLALRTVGLAAVVTAASTVLGVGTAFLVTRTDLPASRIFAVLAALPLAVPTYIAAFAWLSSIDGFVGFWAAALVLTLCCYPYTFLPVAAALHRADPAQEDVARSLGHDPWRTFRSVTLPQLRPAVAGGALLVALYVLSDFGAVALLRTDTFTRAVFTAFELGFDRTGALVLSTVLVALTTVLLAGESLTRRRDARYAPVGSGARRPPVRAHLGRWRWAAALLLGGVAGLALGVPALNLLRRLVAGVSRPGSLPEIAAAATNSLTTSAAGAALTMLLALPVGMLVARAPGPVAATVERLSYLTHALPGVVIGLSLVFFGVHVAYPLYQTRWLLTLAYAALFLPLAVAAVSAAAGQAPPVLDDVARSLGRSPMRVFASVTVPLVAPGLAAGAALVFLTCMKELPATLLLRPTGMDTLATELWTHTSVAAYAAAAPYAALLVLLSAVPTWFLAARSGALGPTGDR